MTQLSSLKLPNPDLENELKYRLPGHTVDSKCHLRYYWVDNQRAKQIIILTELSNNPGASITNAAEYIPEQLENFLLKNYSIELTEDAIFIEHYQANHYGENEQERFALFGREGNFQHLSLHRLKLIFENDRRSENISNNAAENNAQNLDIIALLRSWSEEEVDEYDEDELDISYSLRGSPFVDPILDTWTIYKNLKDFPGSFVAVRRIGGYTYADRKNELIINEDIDKIRDVFEREGRIRREAVHNEEDTIIEIWI